MEEPMPELKAELNEIFPLPNKPEPKRSWGRDFTRESGFSLRLPKDYSMSVFIDRQWTTDQDYPKRADYLKREQVLMRMLTCVGEEWELRTEPTGRDEFGLVIYTHKGKAIAAGSGNLQQDGGVHFSFRTLYKGITDGRTKYEFEGTFKNRAPVEVK
jgi:hypothetical protein